jgi:hypothetical protein
MLVEQLTEAPARSASMPEVAQRVRGLDRARRIDAVAARLLEIERERDGYRSPDRGAVRSRLRRRPDGVACFNYMYLSVTETVRDAMHEFEDPEFVERLAIVFAEFYLEAYDADQSGAWVSKAWEPLFDNCRRRRTSPLQFALAGMNAHINNDLPWALLQAWDELGAAQAPDSPRYRDFERINDILQTAAVRVRATLESGLLRLLDRLFGRLDDLAANVVISRARADAWRRGARWRRGLDPESAEAHERHVGYESHLILAA